MSQNILYFATCDIFINSDITCISGKVILHFIQFLNCIITRDKGWNIEIAEKPNTKKDIISGVYLVIKLQDLFWYKCYMRSLIISSRLRLF